MAYQDEILADRPALYWRLGEKSGISQDISGNSLHSNAGSSATYGVTGLLTADVNTAMTFSNTSGLAATDTGVPWEPLDWAADEDRTAELWFKSANDAGGLVQVLCGKMNEWDALNGWKVAFDETDALVLRMGPTSTIITVAGAVWLNDQRHHLVLTRECVEPRANIWIDGSVVATSTNSALDDGQQTSQPFCVGNDASVNDGFVGTIDEVAMYTKVLQPARILAHYQMGIEGPDSIGIRNANMTFGTGV